MDEGWEPIEEEVVQSMYTGNPLVGLPYQGGPEISAEMFGRTAEAWFPGINYECCNPSVPVPERAGFGPQRWARTSCELPKLAKLGHFGKPYEELVSQALGGRTELFGERPTFRRTRLGRFPGLCSFPTTSGYGWVSWKVCLSKYCQALGKLIGL